MRIFKSGYTKPMPAGAKIFSRKGVKYVSYKDRRGDAQTARLTKAGDKILCETKHWLIEFEDSLLIRRQIKAYTNRQASQRLADRIQRLLNCRANNQPLDSELQADIEKMPVGIRDELIGFGLLDSQQTSAGKPLTELVSEFIGFLAAKERSGKYIKDTKFEIDHVFEGCSFFSDIMPTKVMSYLKNLRDSGISYRRSNSYLKSAKSFCKWMVDCGYVSRSPLHHLKTLDVQLDRRLRRRAIDTDEIIQLLQTTINSKERYGMSGYERCLLYYTAVRTGLRVKEIRELKVGSFDLKELTVTVEAGSSKHRHEDILPIRQDMAALLREFFRGRMPDVKAFGGKFKRLTGKTAPMLKDDLTDAGIEYIVGGRVCDFHGLRHSYITAIDRTDATLKERMALARHSDKSNLTLGTYTHIHAYDLRRVIEQFPDVWPSRNQAVKTGTDDEILPESYSRRTHRRTPMDNGGTHNAFMMKRMPLGACGIGAQRITSPQSQRQNPVISSRKCGFTNTAGKNLLESYKSGPVLAEIVEVWPELPEHIKAAIKALIQTYKAKE